MHRLRKALPNLKALVPSLPPKSAVRKLQPSFLQARRRALEVFLATVLLHEELGGSAIAKRWCLDDLG